MQNFGSTLNKLQHKLSQVFPIQKNVLYNILKVWPYFFLLLSLFIHERNSEAAKKEMGVQLRKSKAWFGKSCDPQGFL